MPGLVHGLMVLGVWKVPTCMHAVPASAVVGLERCAYFWGVCAYLWGGVCLFVGGAAEVLVGTAWLVGTRGG